MTYPAITWDPLLPNRQTQSPTDFNLAVSDFLGSLPTLKTQINNANTWVEGQYSQIETLANTKISDITILGDQYLTDIATSGDSYLSQFQAIESNVASLESSAQQAADSAASAANFKGSWSALTGSLSVPSSVSHDGKLWALNSDIADVTVSEPSYTNTDWTQITQVADRAVITTPATLNASGNYFVIGDGNVTIPTQSLAGRVFDFVAAIGSTPKIYGDITTANFGNTDFVELDNQTVYQFIYNDISGKLEI